MGCIEHFSFMLCLSKNRMSKYVWKFQKRGCCHVKIMAWTKIGENKWISLVTPSIPVAFYDSAQTGGVDIHNNCVTSRANKNS